MQVSSENYRKENEMHLCSRLIVVAIFFVMLVQPCSEAKPEGLGAYGAELWRATVASLNGKTHMGFLVMEGAVNPVVDAERYFKLQDDLAGKLSKAGIAVMDGAEAVACHDTMMLGCASLNMLFHILDDGRGGYVLSCHLTFDQRVLLANGRSMMATTIDYAYTSFGPRTALLTDIEVAGRQCMDDFVIDYLFANQEGYWRKHDSIMVEVEQMLGH